jgi:hypothetical protein
MTDRALELNDIQGNVLGGFNTDIQVLLALTVPQPAVPPQQPGSLGWPPR